jgi:hypothetical protein
MIINIFLSKPISEIPDLTLNASYKKGILTNTDVKASVFGSGINFYKNVSQILQTISPIRLKTIK